MTSAFCVVCNAEQDQPKVFTTVGAGVFLECRRCGLVWLEKSLWPQDQEKHYSTEYYAEDYAGRQDLNKLFRYRFNALKQYLPPPGTLLEVGAASGDFLHLAQEAGYEVRGVELSTRAAAQAEKNYGLHLVQGTLEETAFPAEHFDYVVMYHVLEHVPDPRATLREIRRILKPGGRVLFEVPNVRSIDARFSAKLMRNVLDYPHHLYAFSRSTLGTLVTQEGFGVVTLENSFPFAIAQMVRRVLRRGARGAAAQGVALKAHPSGKALLEAAGTDALVKRLIARVLPGMKLTLVAEKI